MLVECGKLSESTDPSKLALWLSLFSRVIDFDEAFFGIYAAC